jgi:hypothetical protein
MNFDLQQEADYVLGMMDMYQNDEEVAALLKLKGLTHQQVAQVMTHINQLGFEKRIRQARKIILIGLCITIPSVLLFIFFLNQEIYDRDDEFMSRVNARMYTRLPFYASLYGTGQTIYGVYRLILYSIKLRKTRV